MSTHWYIPRRDFGCVSVIPSRRVQRYYIMALSRKFAVNRRNSVGWKKKKFPRTQMLLKRLKTSRFQEGGILYPGIPLPTDKSRIDHVNLLPWSTLVSEFSSVPISSLWSRECSHFCHVRSRNVDSTLDSE